jgi:hypothetical protein
MLTSEDYRELAERCVLLASECAAPNVAEALRTLALDYLTQAARPAAGGKQPRPRMRRYPTAAFPD